MAVLVMKRARGQHNPARLCFSSTPPSLQPVGEPHQGQATQKSTAVSQKWKSLWLNLSNNNTEQLFIEHDDLHRSQKMHAFVMSKAAKLFLEDSFFIFHQIH